MHAATRGFVTLSFGSASYLEMAVDCALAIREHSALPVALVTDARTEGWVRQRYPRVFDHVVLMPEHITHPWARKLAVPLVAPYRRNFYVDADCLLLRDIEDLWDEAEGAPFKFIGEVLEPHEDRNHAGFSTRFLTEKFGIPRYLKSNAGVYYFERPAGDRIAESCVRCFHEELRPVLFGGTVSDETAYGVVGARENLGVFRGSPMLWQAERAAFDPAASVEKPFLHFIGFVSPAGLQWARARIESRRTQAGLAGGSSKYWLQKDARARRRDRLDRLVMPLAPLAQMLKIRI